MIAMYNGYAMPVTNCPHAACIESPNVFRMVVYQPQLLNVATKARNRSRVGAAKMGASEDCDLLACEMSL